MAEAIRRDLNNKIVLLTGPRQCGKTFLSKQLYADFDYLNFDYSEDRSRLREMRWDREKSAVVFDEIHKIPEWKRYLKGIFDVEGVRPRLLVTGSARLDRYRRAGDSLAGRFFQHRLHPIDLKEAAQNGEGKGAFDRLLRCGGFPEPFLNGSTHFHDKWFKSHIEIILRQDLLDQWAIRDIVAIESLVALLRHRVGSTISYANLARDLSRDETTIKRWLDVLESLFLVFRVSPYHHNITRSLVKAPKYYFYDTAAVLGDDSARLENLVATALLKEVQGLDDEGVLGDLFFVRTKDGREVDFLVVQNGVPTQLVEVKRADDEISKSLKYFQERIPGVAAVQLVNALKRPYSNPIGIKVADAETWLTSLSLGSAGGDV